MAKQGLQTPAKATRNTASGCLGCAKIEERDLKGKTEERSLSQTPGKKLLFVTTSQAALRCGLRDLKSRSAGQWIQGLSSLVEGFLGRVVGPVAPLQLLHQRL